MNEIPSFREDHISQIPALQLLIKLGFTYLSPEDALKERGSKSSNVILDNILKKQLHEINSIQYKGKDYNFSDANISYAVAALKNIDLTEGYINAAQQIYDLLTLGKSLEQSIDQDKKVLLLTISIGKNRKEMFFTLRQSMLF
jgi:type I restriction enzyme R subunit